MTSIVALPLNKGEIPRDRVVRIVRSYVGCSLLSRKDELAKLVARGVDKPEAVVGIKTNCATSALGVMALAGVDHALLSKPYAIGMAIAWVRKIGLDLGALVAYKGAKGPQPYAGCLLRYNTAGKNNDHVEWLLSNPDANGVAVHAGGGRLNNAITEEKGNILWSSGRPLVEFWDIDKMVPYLKLEQTDENNVDPSLCA